MIITVMVPWFVDVLFPETVALEAPATATPMATVAKVCDPAGNVTAVDKLQPDIIPEVTPVVLAA